MDKGYVKLHRKMIEWEWYDDIPTKILFLHLLFRANWETKKWHGIEIKRGQFLTSQNTLVNETGLTRQQVRRAINNLITTQEITKQTTTTYTIITINKYDQYQLDNQAKNQRATNGQPTSNQRTTTTKELKELKELKKDIYRQIQEDYNGTCKSLPKCTKITDARKRAIKTILKTNTQEDIKRAFELAEKSDFLSGRSKRWTGCNIDWILKPNNFIKVLEKTYNNKKGKLESHSYDFNDLEKRLAGANKRKERENE